MPSSGQFKLSGGPDKAGNAWKIFVFPASSAEREMGKRERGVRWKKWLGKGRSSGRKGKGSGKMANRVREEGRREGEWEVR